MTSAVTLPALVGCRVTDDDVHQWAKKANGPKRLIAVLTHDKYPTELRVEAAITLVRMKPRGGRSVGLLGGDDYKGLLDALSDLSADKRASLLDGLIPLLETGITAPSTDGETDASFPYKDAAYALLTYDNGSLVTTPAHRERLLKALITWTQSDFEKRFDDTSQLYGMEQVLRLLRTDGVRGLTSLIAADFKKIDNVAKLIHELGDEATQLDASERLVKVARHVDSEAWIKQKAPSVEAANKASKLTVSERQFEAQLAAYQEEELLRVFSAMKSVGKKPIVDYLYAYARDEKNSEKRRAAALAGLEGNVSRDNAEQATVLLELIKNDSTPDLLRDVALRRAGELSREQVTASLYPLFSNKRWQVRWSVASLILKMSEAKHLPEFMTELGKVREFALSEPLAYGPLFHDLKGAEPEALIAPYFAASQPVTVRLSALGYYFRFGNKTDVSKVEAYKNDSQKIPPCPADAVGCEWQCAITEGKEQVAKEVKTVGDYVGYCIIPALTLREPTAVEPAAPSATEQK